MATQRRRPLPLADLRRSRTVTQVHLAAALGVSQSEVSRIERQHNVLVSTVHSYVLALGGQLQLHVLFDDGEEVLLHVIGPAARTPARGQSQ